MRRNCSDNRDHLNSICALLVAGGSTATSQPPTPEEKPLAGDVCHVSTKEKIARMRRAVALLHTTGRQRANERRNRDRHAGVISGWGAIWSDPMKIRPKGPDERSRCGHGMVIDLRGQDQAADKSRAQQVSTANEPVEPRRQGNLEFSAPPSAGTPQYPGQ
jgi:hypothetical protein